MGQSIRIDDDLVEAAEVIVQKHPERWANRAAVLRHAIRRGLDGIVETEWEERRRHNQVLIPLHLVGEASYSIRTGGFTNEVNVPPDLPVGSWDPTLRVGPPPDGQDRLLVLHSRPYPHPTFRVLGFWVERLSPPGPVLDLVKLTIGGTACLLPLLEGLDSRAYEGVPRERRHGEDETDAARGNIGLREQPICLLPNHVTCKVRFRPGADSPPDAEWMGRLFILGNLL